MVIDLKNCKDAWLLIKKNVLCGYLFLKCAFCIVFIIFLFYALNLFALCGYSFILKYVWMVINKNIWFCVNIIFIY